jgi:hypothetical protein
MGGSHRAGTQAVGFGITDKLQEEPGLLSPFPLSSETEERGMKYVGGQPGVALADSLTPGYFLKPLRGFGESRMGNDGLETARGQPVSGAQIGFGVTFDALLPLWQRR